MVGVIVNVLFYSDPPFIEWALPDQLVCSTVSAILRVCSPHPDRVDHAVDTILQFISRVVQKLPMASRESS